MIRIKEFNTAYWGRIGTASIPYQFDEKVNAFVGASGSGKTTLMDALRIALGDAKFEYNRAMDHYINKISNWSVVQVAFWNRENENQPFLAAGYKESVVTVCVRIDRSSGEPKREYYIFDGSFRDIVDLGQNPKAYKIKVIKYGEYLNKLESAGLTSTFRKLMLMKPEDVQNVVGLNSNRLFQLIFDIKGQKAIQDEHDTALEKLKEVKNLEHQSSEDLIHARKTLNEYEIQKMEFENNEQNKIKKDKTNKLLLKRRYWENKNELERQQKKMSQEEMKQDSLEEAKKNLDDSINSLEKELRIEDSKAKELKNKLNLILERRDGAQIERTTQENKCKSLNNTISELESISYEDTERLNNEFSIIQQDNLDIKIKYRDIQDNIKRVKDKLNTLIAGYNAFPSWVTSFKKNLEDQKVSHLIVAENISIKQKYEKWIVAIEAYLGKERYRIVTSAEEHLKAKKLQEFYEYEARVSQARTSKRSIKFEKPNEKFVTLRSALEVKNEDQLGGYLDFLNNIYLVETVEEGHSLSLNGYKSLTQKGLMQDKDGGLFLKVRELVCGGIAREKYKVQLEGEIKVLAKELNLLVEEKKQSDLLLEEFSRHIKNQERLLELPKLYVEKEQEEQLLFCLENQLTGIRKEYNEVENNWTLLTTSIKELEKQQVQKSADLTALQKEIYDVRGTINGYKGSIGSCKIDLSNAVIKLEGIGYDEHAISFIEMEIKEESIFMREDEDEWSIENLERELNHIIEQIDKFEKYSNIDLGVIAMVEPQKKRVDVLEKTYDSAKEDRARWEEQLALAELALKNHVQETMSQYIEEFKSMAELLGAKAEGKFQQDGPSYVGWKIKIKIGFDGKELVDYDDPEFSSGQRAAISIMLLLAAVSNQKEGTKNSLMFLDEPTARVDDARANEIGTILQKSNVQYFITHQISESLKSIDWIDHAFITSKLREGQQFADSPIFESRRR